MTRKIVISSETLQQADDNGLVIIVVDSEEANGFFKQKYQDNEGHYLGGERYE